MKTIRCIYWRVRVWWVKHAEARAFIKVHGRVISTEPMPKEGQS
jgi:hypothetical protein